MRSMVFPREVLNELKWRPGVDLDRARIHYEHRGTSGNARVISGKEIVDLGRSFFGIAGSKIPYHRIRRIELLDDEGGVSESWSFPP